MINRERLTDLFMTLVRIDSVSREEIEIADKLEAMLREMGARTVRDNAGERINGTCGNLIAYFPGSCDASPIMLNAHMDTVEPGRGVRPILEDGVFTSDGTTILGADDKSGIAIFMESIFTIQEKGLPHGPIELVLTIAEENGLNGAKGLDYSLIKSKYGYTLDTTDTRAIVTRAPGANRIRAEIYGREAHAGVVPENGINAISVAAKAISRIESGRIDHETTCNIGTIQGGTAINIVPNFVSVHGEARSHDPEKLKSITQKICDAFKEAAAEYPPDADGLPRVEIFIDNEFPGTRIPDDHPVVRVAQQAARNLGKELVTESSGGGADANIFFDKGLFVGVLGTGMQNIHTVQESVTLDDMTAISELIIEILRFQAEGAFENIAQE